MKSETQPEQPTASDAAVKSEAGAVNLTAHRMGYKSVLAAVVIGIITISLLWAFAKRKEDDLVNNSSVMTPEVQTLQVTEKNELSVTPIATGHEAIEHQLASMFEHIERGFRAQQTNSSVVNQALPSVAESLQAIKTAIVELEESNQEQSRHIIDTNSRLATIAKEVRTLKVVNRKSAVKHKPRPIKSPPFNIDAIDVWDGVTYIAVSQSGRVAFLKAGEQQSSGWTVTHIDHMKGRVDFQGPANQVYTASVPR